MVENYPIAVAPVVCGIEYIYNGNSMEYVCGMVDGVYGIKYVVN